MEGAGKGLLSGTFGYFRGTWRQVAVEEEATLTPLDSPTMTLGLRALNPNEWLTWHGCTVLPLK